MKTKKPQYFINSTRGTLNGNKKGSGWEKCSNPIKPKKLEK